MEQEEELNNLLPSDLFVDSDDGSNAETGQQMHRVSVRSQRNVSRSMSVANEPQGRPLLGRSYDSQFMQNAPPPPLTPTRASLTAVLPPTPPQYLSPSPKVHQQMMTTATNQTPNCKYCLSVNLPSHGHTAEQCPELMALAPCMYCCASGVNNHTPTHCPSRPVRNLTLREEFSPRKNESGGGSGGRRGDS